MPRAATAIIAIACSTSYLGPEVGGIVQGSALRSDAKSKRNWSLSKRVVSKQPLVSDYETEGTEDDSILMRLVSWSPSDIAKFSTDIATSNDIESDTDTISEVGDYLQLSNQNDDHFGAVVLDSDARPSTKLGSQSSGAAGAMIPPVGALPEELLLSTLKYTGAAGRAVSRAAQRSCDAWLRQGFLPTFPLHLCVKQHYHFNSQRPVTTKWSLDVATPSTACSLEVRTESPGEENALAHQSSQSGAQVLRLCQEMRALQTAIGVLHKEAGRTQVEITAKDATGRTFLDHAYDHRIFWSAADDLLELLTESELPVSSPCVQSPLNSDDESEQDLATTRTHTGRAALSRPVSSARS